MLPHNKHRIPTTRTKRPKPVAQTDRQLHRIGRVREREGMTLRSVARHMGVGVRQLRREENEAADLTLSRLVEWQRALNVPLLELLVDNDEQMSPSVIHRGALLKIMKTVAAIIEQSDCPDVKTLAGEIADSLTEAMPELAGVGAWPSVGQRRTSEDFGRVVECPVSAETLGDE